MGLYDLAFPGVEQQGLVGRWERVSGEAFPGGLREGWLIALDDGVYRVGAYRAQEDWYEVTFLHPIESFRSLLGS